jgi:hypothetical protein
MDDLLVACPVVVRDWERARAVVDVREDAACEEVELGAGAPTAP